MKIRSSPPLTQARLQEKLHYDPLTGVFTRLDQFKNRAAGTISDESKLVIYVDCTKYQAHRLAWLYVYGAWPAAEIDHLDGNTLNNAIANLRDVTRSVNMQNQRRAKVTNRLGILGVSRRENRYVAGIGVDGKRLHLGYYDTAADAHEAYLAAKRAFHAGCTL